MEPQSGFNIVLIEFQTVSQALTENPDWQFSIQPCLMLEQ